MKKVLTLVLTVASIGYIAADKADLDQAKKLSGKVDKIEDARNLIKRAINSPEANQNSETYFIAGKIEMDAYDKQYEKLQLNPKDPSVNKLNMANELLNGYNYFMKALPLDSMPDEKGKVKAKNSKAIYSNITGKKNRFFDAGAEFFNNEKYYPEAYNAFMIYGDIAQDPRFSNALNPIENDSIVGMAYFYAGRGAYAGSQINDALKAFEKARAKNLLDTNLYIYEIASYQFLSKQDSTMIEKCEEGIFNVSKDAYNKFGIDNPLFINNVALIMSQKGQKQEAINLISNEITKNPENAKLLGLRGYIYDRSGEHDLSIADYKKAANMPGVDFETLLNAGKKVFRVGTQKWNLIEGNSAEARAARKDIHDNYFMVAKDIAMKAKQIKEYDSQLDNLLESIDYALETYFPANE